MSETLSDSERLLQSWRDTKPIRDNLGLRGAPDRKPFEQLLGSTGERGSYAVQVQPVVPLDPGTNGPTAAATGSVQLTVIIDGVDHVYNFQATRIS